jgi:hypothetical protein
VLLGAVVPGALAFSRPELHGLGLGLLWLLMRASTWPVGGMMQLGHEAGLAAGLLCGGLAGGLVGGWLRRRIRG